MIKEILRIVEEMLPLKSMLPKEIVIGKLVFDFPMNEMVKLAENRFTIKERTKGDQSTYQVTYQNSACLKQGVYSTYKGTQHAIDDQIVVTDPCSMMAQYITKDMIHDFVTEIHDENPIHQKPRRIVPGLLLLNILLEALDKDLHEKQWSCRVRFIHPLFENERYEIGSSGTTYTIRTNIGKEILRLTLEEKR